MSGMAPAAPWTAKRGMRVQLRRSTWDALNRDEVVGVNTQAMRLAADEDLGSYDEIEEDALPPLPADFRSGTIIAIVNPTKANAEPTIAVRHDNGATMSWGKACLMPEPVAPELSPLVHVDPVVVEPEAPRPLEVVQREQAQQAFKGSDDDFLARRKRGKKEAELAKVRAAAINEAPINIGSLVRVRPDAEGPYASIAGRTGSVTGYVAPARLAGQKVSEHARRGESGQLENCWAVTFTDAEPNSWLCDAASRLMWAQSMSQQQLPVWEHMLVHLRQE